MRGVWAILLLLVIALISGCGKGEVRGQIGGKVTFQGQPVSEGRVVFSNFKKGIHVAAELRADGSYEVITAKSRGLPLETYEVGVIPPPPPMAMGPADQSPPIKQYPNIPLKYRDPKTSSLTLTVQKDDNAFDIEMK